jgi:excisionase family DNA binding protein
MIRHIVEARLAGVRAEAAHLERVLSALPPDETPRLYDVEIAAQSLCMSEPELRRLVRRGEIAVVRTGRRIKIESAEIWRYIEARRSTLRVVG